MTAGPGVTRTCPACSRRWNQVVADDCPVCGGDGVLRLGPAILRRYSAETVARAIEIALELRAAHDLRATRVNFDAARQNQTVLVNRLRKSGILAPRKGPVEQVPFLTTEPHAVQNAVKLARPITEEAGVEFAPQAALRWLAMPPITYDPGAIPVDGARPGFSVAGYLCSLARVNDPIQPLDRGPGDQSAVERNSTVLGTAIFNQT